MLKISKKAFELFKETEKSAPGNMENKLLLANATTTEGEWRPVSKKQSHIFRKRRNTSYLRGNIGLQLAFLRLRASGAI